MARIAKADQSVLLGSQWRYLLVLDAARADMVCARWPQFDSVAALGGITHVWCANLWQLVKEPMVYISANPVTSWKHGQERARHVQMIDAWRECWREWRVDGQRLGSVHPGDLNKYVLDWLSKNRLPWRLVVHYLQPHTPYVIKPLPMQIGNLQDGPTGKQGDTSIAAMVKAKHLTWQQVRESYGANLDFVMPYALELAKQLQQNKAGTAIITSDHGEALGEEGHWGHAGIPYGLIRQVPIWSSDSANLRR